MVLAHPHFAALAAFPLHRDIGVEFLKAADGRSQLAFTVTEAMLTPAPALHAGYLYAVSDLAAYVALLSLLDPQESAVTHDIHVSVMRSAQQGERVEVCAEVVRRGRTLAFIDARCEADGRLLSTARVTKSMMGGRQDAT
jgi:uncharacterized protein (TIGR00369 family)